MRTTTLSPTTIVTGHFGFAEIHLQPENNHRLLIAVQSFSAGEVICDFGAAETHQVPSRYTVQIAEDRHIILSPEFLQYINHSCNPNTFFNTTTMKLEALKNIEPGEQFTFFYPSTEWFMAEPFVCFCGEANCLGTIQGAKEIPVAVLQQYRLTDFIMHKVFELKD